MSIEETSNPVEPGAILSEREGSRLVLLDIGLNNIRDISRLDQQLYMTTALFNDSGTIVLYQNGEIITLSGFLVEQLQKAHKAYQELLEKRRTEMANDDFYPFLDDSDLP